MRCPRMRWTHVLSLVAIAATTATAQEFRVYTAVHQCAPDAATRRVVARSLTLFHAGRVYDHMEDVGELVIFEPVQNRFILIRDSVATELSLDELRKMLDVAATAAREYAAELAAHGDAESQATRSQLLFQLQPEFETRLNTVDSQLSLLGPELHYSVKTSSAASEDVRQAYLRYADWTARLNTVLHSQSTFPGSREALNRELNAHRLLPLKVTLQARDPRALHLEAEHEFRWQLQAVDRDLIHQWERLRESDRLNWVSFREYQQKLLAAASRGS